MRTSRRIQTLTAVGLGTALLMVRGPGPAAVVGVYAAVVTLPLIAMDVRERRLPNVLVLPGYAFAGVAAVWEALARGSPGVSGVPGVPGAGLVAAGCVLAVLGALAVGGGLGMGDVKLAGVLAVAVGDVVGVVVWLGAAFLTLAVVGVVEWAAGVAARRVRAAGRVGREVAFGPILLGAFWPVVLAG